MGSLQTVLPFKLAATDESLTAHGGLALFDEYLRAMGVAGLIGHELPRPGGAAGYEPSAHVLPLVLTLAGGGRTLEDLRVLRNDEGLRALLQLEDMPSSDATGDWLRRMGAQGLGSGESETNGLAGMGRVNRSVFRRLLRQDDRASYTLDIDATQIVAQKREAHYTYTRRAAGDLGIYISTHSDELVSVEDVFDGAASPEDYLSAFERFVRENMNASAALLAATQKPRELTRKELKALAAELDDHGFSEAKLRRAYGRARNADIAAHIIGFVRQAALGDPLVPYAARVDSALARIEASKNWTTKQKQWLRRIGRVLKEQPVGDRAILAEPAFAAQGGFETVDAEFGHGLQDVLADLNEAIWGRAS